MMAVFFILTAAVGWGMTGLFSRMLSEAGFSSFQVMAVRAVFSAVILGIGTAIFAPKKLRVRWRDLWMFFGTGICSIVLCNVCFFTAVTITTLSVASILMYTAPVFVMLLSALFFHERINARKLAALVLSLAGCAMVTGVLTGEQAVGTAGILLGVGSGVGYALYSIFGRVALEKYDPFTVTAYTFFIAALVALPLCRPLSVAALFAEHHEAILPAVLLAVVSTVLPYSLYTLGLQRTEPGKASVMASLEPVIASLVGIVVYREPLYWFSIVGAALVLLSVVLLNVPPRHRASPPAPEK
jgi:drug/metabolite transporter (DMT)-like permease